VNAERALSRALAGNCQLPLGAFAQLEGARVRLRGFVASKDGSRVVRAELSAEARDAEALGTELANELRAQGATEILAALGA
jgi:hydroxymethylbilane synthase